MPSYRTWQGTQLTIGLELTNIIPLKDIAAALYTKTVGLKTVREFRDQGTDMLVEEDLASIFGRGRIADDLLEDWKQQLQPGQNENPPIIELFKLSGGKSRIELHGGSSAVALRAANDKTNVYLAAMITLSMLSYFHRRGDLATLISSSLQTRQANGGGEPPDPGVGGITNSLRTCTVDTGTFDWASYSEQVKVRLSSSIPQYKHDESHITFTPSVFLGALDFLYIVQRFPVDKKITVSHPPGCIPLIIWAHNILGLTVEVKGLKGARATFPDGLTESPQVLINWPEPDELESDSGDLTRYETALGGIAEICLLESDMSVTLIVFPDDRERQDIAAEERHPLRGYGTAYLKKAINSTRIISKTHSIWNEAVSIAGGLALHISQRLVRHLDFNKLEVEYFAESDLSDGTDSNNFDTVKRADLDGDARIPQKSESQDDKYFQKAGFRRPIEFGAVDIEGSAQLLFHGLKFDARSFNEKADFIENDGFGMCMRNNTIKEFIKTLKMGSSTIPLIDRLARHIEHLARLIIAIAHIVGIDKYARTINNDAELHEDIGKMQLILHDESDFLQFPNTVSVRRDPAADIPVDPTEAFHAMAALLSTAVLDPRDDTRSRFPKNPRLLYLYSDNGWSVFLDTVGDKDPSEVRPERIHLRRGTPTDKITLHRKFRIRDGPGIPSVDYPDSHPPPEIGKEYKPRCVARAKVQQYWRILPEEFEQTLFYRVTASEEWKMHTNIEEFEEVAGFRKLQECLWQTFSTPTCPHNRGQRIRRKATCELGSDTAAIIGWSEPDNSLSQYRILIFLTSGDRNIRWLALKSAVDLRRYEKGQERYRREVMLRTHDCCEACALEHVAKKEEGQWVVIL